MEGCGHGVGENVDTSGRVCRDHAITEAANGTDTDGGIALCQVLKSYIPTDFAVLVSEMACRRFAGLLRAITVFDE